MHDDLVYVDSYQVCRLHFLLLLGRLWLGVGLGWCWLARRALHTSEEVLGHLHLAFVLGSNEGLLGLFFGGFFRHDWRWRHHHSFFVALGHWSWHWSFFLLFLFVHEVLEGRCSLLGRVGHESQLLLFLFSSGYFIVLAGTCQSCLLHEIVEEGQALSELRLQLERVPHCSIVLCQPLGFQVLRMLPSALWQSSMSPCLDSLSSSSLTSECCLKLGTEAILTRASSGHFLLLWSSQSQSKVLMILWASSASFSGSSAQQLDPISPMIQVVILMTKSVGTTLSISSSILSMISSPKLALPLQFSMTSLRKLLRICSERYSLPSSNRICMVSRYHLWVVLNLSANQVILRTSSLRKKLSVEAWRVFSIFETMISTLSWVVILKSRSNVSFLRVSSLLQRHSTMVIWYSSSSCWLFLYSMLSAWMPKYFMLLVLRVQSSLVSTRAASRCRSYFGYMLAMVLMAWQVTAMLMLLLVYSLRLSTCSRMVQQCYEAFWSLRPRIYRIFMSFIWIQGAGIRWQSNSLGSLCSITCLRMMTKLPARSLYLRGFSLTSSRYRLRAAAMTLGSLSQSPFFILSLQSSTSVDVSTFIFCRTRIAFFLTRSVVWISSLVTGSRMAEAMVAFMMLPREVRQMTTSWTSVLARSLRMVATSMISRSLSLSKKREHIRQPSRFSCSFLFWVRLMAWMWAKGAECPSISMQSARMRLSRVCLVERLFSASLPLREVSSPRMMRSSSCLDLVSPMLLMSSLRSLLRCEEAVAIIYLSNSTIQSGTISHYQPLSATLLTHSYLSYRLTVQCSI